MYNPLHLTRSDENMNGSATEDAEVLAGESVAETTPQAVPATPPETPKTPAAPETPKESEELAALKR